MRIDLRFLSALTVLSLSCKSVPASGPLGEGAPLNPRISAVDSTRPPRTVSIELDKPGYAVVVLVAPGHSASLVYPSDSATNNRFSAGPHELSLMIPDVVRMDSSGSDRNRPGHQLDSSIYNRGRQRDTTMRPLTGRIRPISATTPTYLLLVTSPQPLIYRRLVEKTAGVSIPTAETEALNAVAKAIKATIPSEPRDWAGAYQRVEVRQRQRQP